MIQSFHWGRETLGRAIRMRLILGTKHYNYLVRLGFPLPPQEAIDSHIASMEKEIENGGSLIDEGRLELSMLKQILIL